MPQLNETLVAIPPEVQNVDELRQFLVKLIVALDVLIGYRGGAGVDQLVSIEDLTEAIDGLQVDIKPLDRYEQTIDPTFSQAQIQDLSDAVTRVTDKVNEIVS